MLFCEGTRFTPKKHQVSMQVAESKGLPQLKYHLLPRTKGFWVTVQNLRGTGEHQDALHGFAKQMLLRITVYSRSRSCVRLQPKLQKQPATNFARHSQRKKISRRLICKVEIMFWRSLLRHSTSLLGHLLLILLPLLVSGEYHWR